MLYPNGYFVLKKINNRNLTQGSHPHKGVGAYIINLDRSKKRYDYVLTKANKIGLPIHRISAVDGKNLSEDEVNKYVDLKSYQNYLGHYPKRGMIGCNLSHIKVWKTFLASNYQFALVLEDDINFDPVLLSSTVKSLKQNAKLWDINNFEMSHRGLPLTVKYFANIDKSLVVYLMNISHTGAYIINRTAAQRLLERALPIKLPIDHYFYRSWEFGLKFTGIEPRIVVQDFGDSYITVSSDKYTGGETFKMSQYWNKVSFKLQTCVIRFFYSLKVYTSLRLQQLLGYTK